MTMGLGLTSCEPGLKDTRLQPTTEKRKESPDLETYPFVQDPNYENIRRLLSHEYDWW